MSSARLILTFGLAAVILAFTIWARAEPAAPGGFPPFTNAIQIRKYSGSGSGRNNPIHLQGVITLVDADRGLVVLQDATGPVGLRLDLTGLDLKAGQEVLLEAAASSPFFATLPEYPLHPLERTLLTRFECPTNCGEHYATRIRGYVHPPATGEYRFWIASDDSSELWLGTNASPDSARKIASVQPNRWTELHEWNRFPSQGSEPMLLKAGEKYYIEAVHEQGLLWNHLEVAWQGPGMGRTIIEGGFLSPYVDALNSDWITRHSTGPEVEQPFSSMAAAVPRANSPVPSLGTGVILREFWTNCFIKGATDLSPTRNFESLLALEQPRARVLAPGPWPKPVQVRIGQPLSPEDDYRWVEVEGTVTFVAQDGNSLSIELSDGETQMKVRVLDWGGNPASGIMNWRVRVQGVCTAVVNSQNERVAGTLWIPKASKIPLVELSPEEWNAIETTPFSKLTPDGGSAMGNRRIKVRGKVVSQNPGTSLLIQNQDILSGYYSLDGTNWVPTGVPVEVPMSNSVCVGLAITSHDNDALATAVFDQVTGLPETVQDLDIGSPNIKGSAQKDGQTWTIKASGRDIWDQEDQFHFLYAWLDGDFEISARVKSLVGTQPWTKAGVMIRKSLDSDAPFADVVLTKENEICLQWRSSPMSTRPDSEYRGLVPTGPWWLKLVRHHNILQVQTEQRLLLNPGQLVEVLGFPDLENGVVVIREGSYHEVVDEAEQPAPKTTWETTLLTIKNTLIGNETGELPNSFRIKGVVTFKGTINKADYLFVQDDTGSIGVLPATNALNSRLEQEDLVEIQGERNLGKYAPVIQAEQIEILGKGTMPRPLTHPMEYFVEDRGEGRWVEVQGVVHSVDPEGTIQLAERGELLLVSPNHAAGRVSPALVDSLVRIRGVMCFSTDRGQMLLVPSLDHIQVLEPALPDPFMIPSNSIADLNSTNWPVQQLHRLRLAGRVTYQDRHLLFIQDQSDGLRVQTVAAPTVRIGDKIEAVGFLETQGGHALTLVESLVRKIGSESPPNAIPADIPGILQGRHDATLARLEAVLLEQVSSSVGDTLQLRAGQTTFLAKLVRNNGKMASVAPGSRVQVTGIAQVESDPSQQSGGFSYSKPLAGSFELLLRSPEDVVVLAQPSWWTMNHALMLAGGLLLVLLVAFGWIQALRYRVQQRTLQLQSTMTQLRKETQLSATLVERNRLAGEIHDSVEQGLNGLILHLDTIAKLADHPSKVREYLSLARNMVAFSRAEVKHAVWDLQSPILESADLGTALARIAKQISPDSEPRVTVQIQGETRPLSKSVEHHLLRIGQEAITNAVKHAGAKHIEVTVIYTQDEMRLSVHDDGCGFQPDAVLSHGVGHFGLRSLRVRGKRMNGQLDVSSQPGQGTTILVTVPLKTIEPSTPEPD
jgi:signal transduction histidine kinase